MSDLDVDKVAAAKKQIVEGSHVLWNERLKQLKEHGNPKDIADHVSSPAELMMGGTWGGGDDCDCGCKAK